MEIFLKFTLYFCLIVFYYLVVMNERKNILLSIYLIFKYLVLIAWLINGTFFYLFLLLLFSPDNYLGFNVQKTPADFGKIFVVASIIYTVVTFLSINSTLGIHKLLKNKALSVLNYITLPLAAILEIGLLGYISLKYAGKF